MFFGEDEVQIFDKQSKINLFGYKWDGEKMAEVRVETRMEVLSGRKRPPRG